MLMIVSYPTIEEVKAAAAAGNPEAVAELPRIEQFQEFQRKFEGEKLAHPWLLGPSTIR
jgi:hypothetical protein